ncbi:MAG: response regulator [Defluviitaleaceae bacterium]|nr:response regulator [Defluviitaleaceae bacterium]
MKHDGQRYFHRVPGLLVPKSITSDEVHLGINDFIDTIPNLAMTLEDNLLNIEGSGARQTFASAMDKLLGLLKIIYARSLETEAAKMLQFMKDDKFIPLAKKNFKAFIMEVLSLSVAMQKAQKAESTPKAEVKAESKIERHVNTSKSINTVSSLLEDGFYEPARVLLADLVAHNPETVVFANLLVLFDTEKYDEARTMISDIKQKFNETLSQLAGTNLNKIILAVDDMPEILSFVNNALKSHYKVVAVPSGKAALKVMETQKPDLFVLDIDMPEMDGFQLATIIRGTPQYAATPLIFLTGNSSREYIDRATAIGANDFIVKPASHEYLLTKVGSFLNE